MRKSPLKRWEEKGRSGSNGGPPRHLAPRVTPGYLGLYTKKEEPHSALLTQLRTGNIASNLFLKE